MRTLVVEDDQYIAAVMQQGLVENGYVVDIATTGDEALALAATVAYDLIVLDIRLPDRDGIAVTRVLRSRGIQTPLLMVTAAAEVEDRVRGLDAGADDYLVKPFAFAELLARLRALTRRQPSPAGALLTVGDLTLNRATRQVTRQGMVIELKNKEFALLEFLMRHPNQVLSRETIAAHVWTNAFNQVSNVIDVHIRYIRRKIDDPFPVKLIHTERGVGYRIAAPPDD